MSSEIYCAAVSFNNAWYPLHAIMPLQSFYHITHGWVVETIAKELDHEIAKQLNYKSGGPARKHIGLAEAH
jgi:hypothetical protein